MNSRASKGQDMSTVKTLRFKCHLLAKTGNYLQLPSVLCSWLPWVALGEVGLCFARISFLVSRIFLCDPRLRVFKDVQSQSCQTFDNIKRCFSWLWMYECGTLWLWCTVQANSVKRILKKKKKAKKKRFRHFEKSKTKAIKKKQKRKQKEKQTKKQ